MIRGHVLILDGNSEIDVHLRSNLCYLICLMHLIRARALNNRIFFSEKTLYSELPSNISTTVVPMTVFPRAATTIDWRLEGETSKL